MFFTEVRSLQTSEISHKGEATSCPECGSPLKSEVLSSCTSGVPHNPGGVLVP
ncbi:unnamed protein product [Staurois parvus]|uniref:Uncharacterized protein n=1 Tax=Staurois parvus TaxID=386267 RepID=A0ABN9BX80_9NEOB|nr:unnamed protein product [Staurois parvus]